MRRALIDGFDTLRERPRPHVKPERVIMADTRCPFLERVTHPLFRQIVTRIGRLAWHPT